MGQHLRGNVERHIAVGTQEYLAAVHSSSGETPNGGVVARVQAEDDDVAARLIFAEERTRFAANNKHGNVRLVRLHVDTRAIADVPLDKNRAAAHGIARRVAAVAVDGQRAAVHGIARGVLRIAEDFDVAAVQIAAQRIARNTVNRHFFAGQPRANIPLSAHVVKLDFRVRTGVDFLVQLAEVLVARYDSHSLLPPISVARSRRENAINCGLSSMSSKSMLESGVFSRISAV